MLLYVAKETAWMRLNESPGTGGDYLGLSSWALNAVTSVLIRGRQRRRNVTTEARCSEAGFRNGGRGLGPRNAKNSVLETEKGEEWILPKNFQREPSPANTLILVQ